MYVLEFIIVLSLYRILCTMIDPLENGLFDIPDYEHIEDETFPPFPPPSSPGRRDLGEDAFGNGEGLLDCFSFHFKIKISVGFLFHLLLW